MTELINEIVIVASVRLTCVTFRVCSNRPKGIQLPLAGVLMQGNIDHLRIVCGNLGRANAEKVMLLDHTKSYFWIDWRPFLSQVISCLLPDSIPFRPKRATWLIGTPAKGS
jgi:hypothetical protein